MPGSIEGLLPLYLKGVLGTLVVAAAAYWACLGKTRRIVERAAPWFALASGALFLVSAFWLSWAKGEALNHYADRATHLEILWRFVSGQGLTTPMSEDYHRGAHWFAAHFTPIVYLSHAPFFALAPGQLVLCVLQAAYLALAAWPIWLFSRARLGAAPAALLVSAYFLYPTLHYIGIYGTAYLELSIPILAGALWAYEERRDAALLVFVALALAVREEIALVIFGFGAYIAAQGRRRLGLSISALGLLYFVAAIKWIIPSFRDDQSLVYMRNYASWGSGPMEMVFNALSSPIATMAKLLSIPRLGNVVMYLLPLGFLPLLNPLGLLIAAPNAATTLMSDSVTNYSFTLYYLAPTIPVLFFCAIRSIAALERRSRGIALPLTAAAAVASLSASHFFGPSVISRQYWDDSYRVGHFRSTSYHRTQYVPTEGAKSARRLASLVPREASVAAPQHILPLLFDRKRMAVFPKLDEGIDHVLIDRSRTGIAGWAETYEDFRRRPEHYYAVIETNPAWELAAEDGAARLYRRRNR